MTSQPRSVARVVRARDTSDGAGVRLRRSLGGPELSELDPFLLLDEFRSDDPGDYLAGFPDHPHRGFETVTYMLAGHMEHRDHMGNRGDLAAGSVQWMTAGRGIIHSEMPRQEQGLMWGFQLWVNLPAKDKLCPPRYQDIPPDAVPEVEIAGGAGSARVVAGSFQGTAGAVSGIATDPLYLDLRLAPKAEITVPFPLGHAALAYVYGGEAWAGSAPGMRLATAQLGVLGDGDELTLRAGEEGARLLLIAGKPLKEPIVRHGPFVMNTREEIMQAVRDYQTGRLLA